MRETAIHAENLRKSYGQVKALDGLDLDVYRGEIFGIVGPNGAGKTTAIDCFSGMRKVDSGTLRTLGMDPSGNASSLRGMIGLQQQESQLPARMKVRESIRLFSALFGVQEPGMELLDRVGLAEKAEDCFSNLSGGQKRRLFVALSMVHDPELILLDELTSGLDPRGRRELWSLVRQVKDEGMTVVLSTHYMDEAQKLCDRIAIVDRGRVAALDTPEALINRYCPGMLLKLGCSPGFDVSVARRVDGVLSAELTDCECTMELRDAGCVVPLIKALSEAGENLGDLHTQLPTLEDVFMALTGREYGEEEE